MTDIKTTVRGVLQSVERDNQLVVLYACESGSRAWGFESTDSDWDVRFVFVRQADAYLSLDPPPEQVERHEESAAGLLDVVGWDLAKALRLLRKSNPALIEWVRSPIVYACTEPFFERFRDLVDRSFSRKPSAFHYGNIARSNFQDFLQGDQVKLKRYFYVLRALLAYEWVKSGRGIPPMPFDELVSYLVDEGSEVMMEVEELLAKKRAAVELGLGPRLPPVHAYIQASMDRVDADLRDLDRESFISETIPTNAELNDFLRAQVKAVQVI